MVDLGEAGELGSLCVGQVVLVTGCHARPQPLPQGSTRFDNIESDE